MNDLDIKYAKLVLERCLSFKKSNSLFISYNKLNKEFVNLIIKLAKKMGINDIYEEEIDYYYKHDLLMKSSIEEISENPYFSSAIWDTYAKRDASFLFIESEMPGLMDDVSPEKLAKSAYIRRYTKPIYNEKRDKGLLSWCIIAYPNEIWANKIFKDDASSYMKLKQAIFNACMINTENPIESWNRQLDFIAKKANKLNELNIKKLNITNSLGTNLELELPNDAIWCSASEGEKIVNMPSYEIFTSPDYLKTNGIVYSALPLIYNGALVKDFYLEFKGGKVVNFDALVGKDILEGIINSDPYACYLGEVALVNNDSPISNTGLIFETTLFDENASCHLALGSGFNECIKDGVDMSSIELKEKGINQSKNHVDFMIGTKDLKIIATTSSGDKVTIFEMGNFCI